jgi:tripartite-type tricarboxylate transporter receptor subunit TctC
LNYGSNVALLPSWCDAWPAITDLAVGKVRMIVPAMHGPGLTLLRVGNIRVLMVTSPDRQVGAPELATPVETAPGVVSVNLLGRFSPTGTAQETVDGIDRAVRSAMFAPKSQQQLIAAGCELPVDASPDRMRRLLAEEIAGGRR